MTHFDNPVYHLGLEEDDIYLKKVEESLVNLKAIIEQRKINGTEMNLVRAYEVLKKLKLDRIFSFIFTLLKSNIRKKITGNKPSLFFFDLYRLGYLCTLKNSQVENN